MVDYPAFRPELPHLLVGEIIADRMPGIAFRSEQDQLVNPRIAMGIERSINRSRGNASKNKLLKRIILFQEINGIPDILHFPAHQLVGKFAIGRRSVAEIKDEEKIIGPGNRFHQAGRAEAAAIAGEAMQEHDGSVILLRHLNIAAQGKSPAVEEGDRFHRHEIIKINTFIYLSSFTSSSMNLFYLKTYPLDKKTILVRVDYNVPLKDGKVADNTRIKASLPTLQYLLQKKCKLVLATHLGKPDGKIVPALRVDPLAKELQRLLNVKVHKLDDCLGKDIKEKIRKGKSRIYFLENLRFYREEEQNNPIFAHSLASLADIYVNDAFAVCHRQHASVQAITQYLPSLPGLLVEKEIHYLSKALHPERPSVWIMGGAKLDKVDLIQQALRQADYILIGGALAFSFLKAKGLSVGMSKVSSESVQLARQLLQQKEARKIILPVDIVAVKQLSLRAKAETVRYNEIQSAQIGLDLGPETIKLFKHYLYKAKTIVWNGPLGYFEWAKFAVATKEIGRFISSLTATSIVGGGETAEALQKFHLQYTLTHLSTGGGAALQFLAGKKLPGIEALERSYGKFRKK